MGGERSNRADPHSVEKAMFPGLSMALHMEELRKDTSEPKDLGGNRRPV